MLRPRSGPSALARAIAELKAEARAAGLTDEGIDAELAAYHAERRTAPLWIDRLRRLGAGHRGNAVTTHSFTLHTPEVQVLFVTPREGNNTWSGAADGDPNHG